MRRLLLICWAFTGLFASALATASPNDEIYALQQIRGLTQASLSDFYLLYGVDQDPKLTLALEQHILSASGYLLTLQPHSDSGDTGQLAELKAGWLSYARQLKQLNAGMQQQLRPSPQELLQLINLNQQLLEQTSALITAQQGTHSTTSKQHVGWLLQNLSTHYIAYSIGANALGSSQANIDELTLEFSQALNALANQLPNVGENQQLLASIQHKWRYIEPPLQHYNSQATVPYLVNQYTARIIELLAKLQIPSRVNEPTS